MRAEDSGTLTIRTPEGVAFSRQLASPVSRMYAVVIDTLVIAFATVAVKELLELMSTVIGDIALGLVYVMALGLQFGYYILLEWFWRGQTLGKRALGLRVVDASGLRLAFGQVVVRNLLRVIDQFPASYLLGGVAAYFSPRAQRLGDLAANTVVLRTRRHMEPSLEGVLLEAGRNTFRQYPHIEARLRNGVTVPEAEVAVRAIIRRDELEPENRVALFEKLAEHFKSICVFPKDATLGLSAEQYVRNCVDTIYRGRKSA